MQPVWFKFIRRTSPDRRLVHSAFSETGRYNFWRSVAGLILPSFDVLPAEEPGVDGPGARSDHRQGCPERR